MTLRARLLLGYGYLVALLLFTAGSATLSFLHLSAGIEVVLDENFRSIRAAMAMIEALERQDSATLAALIEGQHRDRRHGEPRGGVPGGPRGGRPATSPRRTSRRPWRRSDALLRLPGGAATRSSPICRTGPLTAYNQRVFPRFSAVKHDVIRLLDINQRAMFRADRQARETAVQSSTWLGFMVVVALVSLVFLSRAMQRRILVPARAPRAAACSPSPTDLQGRLREEGDDELAMIARHVNRLLDQNEELKARNQGRLAQERRLVLGLVGAYGEGAALFSLSGELVGGRVEDRALEGGDRCVDPGGRAPSRRGGATADQADRGGEGSGAVEVELLLAPGERPVGWLARPA